MRASIIIPTYKRPGLLRAAMASAARQDFPAADYELVVVNDGGAGVDAKRVRSWWKGKSKLRYARIPHGGLSAAVNRGLDLACGTYVTVLPDDDTVLPNKLAVLVGFLEAHPEADVAYSLPRYIDASGKPTRKEPGKLRQFLRAHPKLTWQHIEAGHGLYVHGVGTMYRRQLCLDVGGWDTKLKTGEEYEFHMRLLKLGHTFYGVDAVTTGYRVHPGNKSAKVRRDGGRLRMRRYINRKLARL